MGNFVICNSRLIETITLPIRIGNWQNSRFRGIGNVVDSITEPRKNNYNHFFIRTYTKYKFISNTKYYF
jgi:hypothetical protein